MASRAPVGQHLAIGDDVLALLQQRQQVGEVMGQETVVAVEKGDIASAGMVYALVARRRRAAIFLLDDLESRIVYRAQGNLRPVGRPELGRAHVLTPFSYSLLVFRLLLYIINFSFFLFFFSLFFFFFFFLFFF